MLCSQTGLNKGIAETGKNGSGPIHGTTTLSPSFKLYLSFIAATNNVLAVLPEETYIDSVNSSR